MLWPVSKIRKDTKQGERKMCGLLGYKGSSLSKEGLTKGLDKITYRGPDDTKIVELENVFLGFHRLSIMDLSDKGDQPFKSDHNAQYLMCNGEIYNHVELRKNFTKEYFKSDSDCEVLLPMIFEYGIEKTCKELDAEFALVYYDTKTKKLMAARDPIGVRPLFYGIPKSGEIVFASEAKAITGLCDRVYPFPPGHYYDGQDFVCYKDIVGQTSNDKLDLESAIRGIRVKLTDGVVKRLDSDAPVSFLLSGGLDSSLVCAIAQKYSNKPIKTFSIGTENDAIDNKYAQSVADYIGSDHVQVTFSKQEVLESLDEVIRLLETWDITTIRASIGMYLVCKYIKENTDTKVLLTGEISDELFGYKYTDYAPNAKEFQKESQKRVRELHYYDVLRADRCISANSLEARVPFGDLDFVDHVMSIPAELKMNTYGQGKYLLRKAFSGMAILPDEILFREKAAFSDAVGHSMVDDIKLYAEEAVTSEELEHASKTISHGTPVSKESLLYRKIFAKHYPEQAHLIPDFWLPNRTWKNCNVTDPSARVLPNYGKSGN